MQETAQKKHLTPPTAADRFVSYKGTDFLWNCDDVSKARGSQAHAERAFAGRKRKAEKANVEQYIA
jgi:hypothetical protein